MAKGYVLHWGCGIRIHTISPEAAVNIAKAVIAVEKPAASAITPAIERHLRLQETLRRLGQDRPVEPWENVRRG